MVGETGPTASDVSVGFTKKPRQPTARDKDASTAKAPIKRSLGFVDDIFVDTPWARLLGSNLQF